MKLKKIPTEKIEPNPEQAREDFGNIRELANSIKEHGLQQPITVCRKSNGYKIISGERRWRALKELGHDKIYCIVKEKREEEEAIIEGLVENLHRKDLNPVEEARGIRKLIKMLYPKGDVIELLYGAERGENKKISDLLKSLNIRAKTAVRIVKILSLPDSVRRKIRKGEVNKSQAFEIQRLEEKDQGAVSEVVKKRSLTTEETARLVSAINEQREGKKKKRGARTSPDKSYYERLKKRRKLLEKDKEQIPPKVGEGRKENMLEEVRRMSALVNEIERKLKGEVAETEEEEMKEIEEKREEIRKYFKHLPRGVKIEPKELKTLFPDSSQERIKEIVRSGEFAKILEEENLKVEDVIKCQR